MMRDELLAFLEALDHADTLDEYAAECEHFFDKHTPAEVVVLLEREAIEGELRGRAG